MNSLPPPALVAAITAVIALPFSLAAAGTLFVTAGLGLMIHADYGRRCRRVRLPRLALETCACPNKPTLTRERHPFAA